MEVSTDVDSEEPACIIVLRLGFGDIAMKGLIELQV